MSHIFQTLKQLLWSKKTPESASSSNLARKDQSSGISQIIDEQDVGAKESGDSPPPAKPISSRVTDLDIQDLVGGTVIKTAKTLDEINAGAKAGYRPLVKTVVRSEEIKSKLSVIQNSETGEIEVRGDYRTGCPSGWNVVIPWTNYYPYNWPNPYAAYLIPPNLDPGATVTVEDPIEDIVGSSWNQGNVFRASFVEATWTGADLVLKPPAHTQMIYG